MARIRTHPAACGTTSHQRARPFATAHQGYVRLRAWVYGEPTWDTNFDTADRLMMAPMEQPNTA